MKTEIQAYNNLYKCLDLIKINQSQWKKKKKKMKPVSNLSKLNCDTEISSRVT